MVTINGEQFYDKPSSCGTCPFFSDGATHLNPSFARGHCRMFDEIHHFYIYPPRRCQKLFNLAFRMPEGSDLVIVSKD